MKSGNVFEESLVTSYPIQISTYTDSNDHNDFAILNGSKEFDTGWAKDTNTVNIYKQDIPYSGFNSYGINGIGSYSYLYVIEVDKAILSCFMFVEMISSIFLSSFTHSGSEIASLLQMK